LRKIVNKINKIYKLIKKRKCSDNDNLNSKK